jgi:hypothetical protein
MEDLQKLMGRFITPTIVIGKQAFLGFGPNMEQIQKLLRSQESTQPQ